jgi:hypothetical protein
VTFEREYCPTCKHIISRDRVNLSSIECRRFIHNITDINMLANAKDYFTRFIRSTYRIKEFADKFSNDLNIKLSDREDLSSIKIWILDFINNPKDLKTLQERFSEVVLYRFLYENYSEINEPFSWFYNTYSSNYDKPMNKNRVSRALSAFGLKTTMKRAIVNGQSKCTMMIEASKDELFNLYQKNGLTPVPQINELH